jgi:hypothetical protein
LVLIPITASSHTSSVQNRRRDPVHIVDRMVWLHLPTAARSLRVPETLSRGTLRDKDQVLITHDLADRRCHLWRQTA